MNIRLDTIEKLNNHPGMCSCGFDMGRIETQGQKEGCAGIQAGSEKEWGCGGRGVGEGLQRLVPVPLGRLWPPGKREMFVASSETSLMQITFFFNLCILIK